MSTLTQILEMVEGQKTWTDEAFMALSDDGHRYELVNGELIDMGNSGAKHGYLAIVLSSALFAVVMAQKLGALFDSSTAFKMKNGNKRSPDISFFAKGRLQGLEELPTGFLDGAPDLVVEVLSPGNTVEEIDDKLVEYFENGARLVWVINPRQQYILVYRSSASPDRLLKLADALTGEEVIPGFSLPVADLFQKLSF
jgi:Uma2 family endonuclease